MRKIYSLSEKYVDMIKDEAKEVGISESEMLRRILDDRHGKNRSIAETTQHGEVNGGWMGARTADFIKTL